VNFEILMEAERDAGHHKEFGGLQMLHDRKQRIET
jgi:hypothetical protein